MAYADERLEALEPIRVEFEHRDHWALNGAVMKAHRTDTGQNWIVIDRHQINHPDFEGRFWHEVAHILTWSRFGSGVQEHGPEFRKTCRELVRDRKDYFCEMKH